MVYLKSGHKKGWLVMSKKRIVSILAILIVVTAFAVITKEQWVSLFYTTILALFPQEIKDFCSKVLSCNRIRISYSYVFRIEVGAQYLLVRDEHGNNKFHPVGGVYKYYPDFNISELFKVEYDNVHRLTSDTENDLRLIIDKKDYKRFSEWFASYQDRETINDLGREFKEELIDTGILDAKIFDKISYGYLGSNVEKSYNKELKMWQIKRVDVVRVRLDKPQRDFLNALMELPSDKYVFVRREDIENRHFHYGNYNYAIATHATLITPCDELKSMDGMKAGKGFNIQISKSHKM